VVTRFDQSIGVRDFVPKNRGYPTQSILLHRPSSQPGAWARESFSRAPREIFSDQRIRCGDILGGREGDQGGSGGEGASKELWKKALEHHRASSLTPRDQEGMIEEEVVHHRLDYRSDREGDFFDQGPRVAHGKPIDYDDEAGGSQRGGWHHSVWSAGSVLVPAVLLLAAGVSLPGWLVVCVFAMICARIRLRPAQTVFPKPPPFLST